METTSLSDLKSHLSEYAERAEREHEQFTITRNGRPAVVMVSADEWESLQETLFWQSQPGISQDVAASRGEYEAGQSVSGEEIRRRYGLGQ